MRTLGSMGSLGPNAVLDEEDRAARYNDWAERLREKRRRAQELQQGPIDAGDHHNYWSTDALYEESRRVDQEQLMTAPTKNQKGELLAVLDLREDATKDDVSDAYRRLAKTHHPDKFVGADDDTREFHAAKMREINSAYRALKTLDRP